MVVHELTSEAAFADAHKQAGGKLVVVDFYATWCGPCKVVAPKFAELSEKYARETYCCKLDVDKVREVAQEAGIKSLPSFGFYAQGRLLELQVGGDPLALASKMSALAQKHGSYAFKGQGHSMLGGSSSSGAGAGSAPVATKAIGANAPSAGASSGRRNPLVNSNSRILHVQTVHQSKADTQFALFLGLPCWQLGGPELRPGQGRPRQGSCGGAKQCREAGRSQAG